MKDCERKIVIIMKDCDCKEREKKEEVRKELVDRGCCCGGRCGYD